MTVAPSSTAGATTRETYVKTESGWRIKTSQLTRLRVEMKKVF
jgi:hypothetical protein